MASFLPINFLITGIIGGGVATGLKRVFALDIRGRMLEGLVVLITLWLTAISCGVVRGFFGDPSQCWGVTIIKSGHGPSFESLSEDHHVLSAIYTVYSVMTSAYLSILKSILQGPINKFQLWFQTLDFVFSQIGFLSRGFFCTPTTDGDTDYSIIGCFPSVRSINPQFYLEEEEGENCLADIGIVVGSWLIALAVLALGSFDRHRRARRLVGLRGRGGNERRPHQD